MFWQMIHNRALETYNGPKVATVAIHREYWVPAWMNAAHEILREFEAEGLENSTAEMRKIIAQTKDMLEA